MTRLGRAALGAPHSAWLCTRGPPSSPNPNPAAVSSRARPPGDCAMPTAVSSGLGLLKGPGSPAECRGEGAPPAAGLGGVMAKGGLPGPSGGESHPAALIPELQTRLRGC